MIWLPVAICLLISSAFSGIEAGILSVNRVRLRHRLKQGDKAAFKLDRLLSHPERLLVTVLIATKLMNICAIVLGTQEIVRMMGPYGYFIAFAISLPIYLFGLELLPKAIFRRFPYRALAAVSEVLRLTDLILSPVLWIGARIQVFLWGHRKPRERKLFIAREDFKYLTVESEREGTLTKIEREMIHNVVDFRAVTAREVMIPIEDAPKIRVGTSLDELLALAHAQDMNRLPVVSANGEIIGLVNVFDVLLDRNPRSEMGSHLRRIVTVAPEEFAYQVIKKMRAARISMAAVTDRNAKVIGVVNSEVVIRRLVKTAVT